MQYIEKLKNKLKLIDPSFHILRIFSALCMSAVYFILAFKFNFDTKKYEIPSIGIANSQDLIVVEVPFDILEYDNRYEVYMYRIYLVQKMEESLDESQVNMKTIAYYDSSLLTKACEVDDENIYSDLNTQKTVLSEQISKGKIDKNILQKVKYTLVKKGSNYKVTKYDKL